MSIPEHESTIERSGQTGFDAIDERSGASF